MRPALALRCDLKVDESLPSWISRLAIHNGIVSAREFCLDMGFTFQACVAGKPQALQKLVQLTGAALPDLEHASIRHDNPDFILRGERFSQNTLRRLRVCVCPECIHDEPSHDGSMGKNLYDRTLWQIAIMRACPKHHCAFVEIAANIGPAAHDFMTQINGRRAELEKMARNTIPRYPSALESYVIDRLERKSTHAGWLDSLDMHVAINTCELLGTLIVFGVDARPISMTDEELHRAGNAGFRIASGGETAIRETLDRIAQDHHYTRSGRQGAEAVYGYFYKSLVMNKRSPSYDPVRDVLRRHIIETMPVGPGDIVIHQPVEKRVLHSIKTAAQETGRNPVRLRKALAAAGLIPANHKNSTSHNVLFKADDAAEFLASYKNGLNFIDVARLLNIPQGQVRHLTAAGLITPRAEHRGGRNDRLPTYSREDIDQFLARLLCNVTPISNPVKPHCSMATAVRYLRCSIGDIIQFIANRQLSWVGRDVAHEGCAAIVVDISELRHLLHRPERGDVAVHRAMTVLKTTKRVVEALIREGYLRRDMASDPISRQIIISINQADIEDFDKKYVSIYRYARDKEMQYNRAARILGRIQPAIGKHIVGMAFYRKDSLPNF